MEEVKHNGNVDEQQVGNDVQKTIETLQNVRDELKMLDKCAKHNFQRILDAANNEIQHKNNCIIKLLRHYNCISGRTKASLKRNIKLNSLKRGSDNCEVYCTYNHS